MTRKCHVPFWRAVALARESLTLIINGARGIFLRALGDTPWLKNQLALVS